MWPLAALAFVAGLLCAPTITATVDQVSQVVPEAARGEAMGWHGSFMTAGSALGAPVAGLAIDRWGWGGGFVSVSLLGLLVAVVGAGGDPVTPAHAGTPDARRPPPQAADAGTWPTAPGWSTRRRSRRLTGRVRRPSR